MVRFQCKDRLFPLLRANWVVFFIVFTSTRLGSIGLVGARVTATTKVLRGALFVLVNDTLMLGSSSGVVEGFGD